MVTEGSNGHVGVLDRAVHLLLAFGYGETALPLTELAVRTGLPKSTVRRLANTLARYNLIGTDGQGNYSLGIRLWELGVVSVNGRLPLRMVEHYAEQAAADWDETCHVAILDGQDVLYIVRVASARAVAVQTHLGQRVPAYATATGMAVLSTHPAEMIRAAFSDPLEIFTESTPRTVEKLITRVEQTRERGYALTIPGWQPDICDAAAPILDRTGHAVAAIGIAGSIYRNTEERLQQIGTYIKAVADEISCDIGVLFR
ncbi:IclR family transcriptional regulator [Rhodococcus jostii]|uniref:IclR family transcriptional regulator n=1 Tax=Rhodococcus jostii TaxID=132919 RepID=UPI00365E983E